MFRFALPVLALLALGGCSTVSFQFNSQKSEKPQTEARSGTPSASCRQDCTLQISMAATAPRGGSGPGANDCTAVTFSYGGNPFESLAVSKGKRAEITLTLDTDTQKFAFFGSDPVSLYNEDKTGPLNKRGLKGQVSVNVVNKATVTISVGPALQKEEFHFGVALGTAKGGCAGDPRIINGA